MNNKNKRSTRAVASCKLQESRAIRNARAAAGIQNTAPAKNRQSMRVTLNTVSGAKGGDC